MINIYVYPKAEFDRNVSCSELIAAYLNKKGVQRHTQEEFMEALNDGFICHDAHRVKMYSDMEGMYPVAFLHADDLKQSGFDTDRVEESDMLRLADKLNGDYPDRMFWESLPILADHIGIPRLNGENAKVSNPEHQ